MLLNRVFISQWGASRWVYFGVVLIRFIQMWFHIRSMGLFNLRKYLSFLVLNRSWVNRS